MLVVDDKGTPASVLPRGSKRRISDKGETVSFYDDHGGVLQRLCAHSGERVA